MATRKKISGLSPRVNASSAGNLNSLETGNVTKWWEERDTQLLPFINLYILVIRYQIHHGLSDESLAIDLGRSAHTVASWREAINVDSVLRGLIGEIESKYGKEQEEAWPIFMRRLKKKLELREAEIRVLRMRIPRNRSDCGVPSGIFPLPAPDLRRKEYEGLLRPLNFAVTGGERSTPSADRLKALVSRLNWSNLMEPPKEPIKARGDLMEKLRVAGALHTQLSFMRKFFPHDSANAISAELTLEIAELKRLAKVYYSAVMLRVCNEAQWWESISISDLKKDESFSSPPASFKTLDSLPKTAQNLAMETLGRIDVFISTLEPKWLCCTNDISC